MFSVRNKKSSSEEETIMDLVQKEEEIIDTYEDDDSEYEDEKFVEEIDEIELDKSNLENEEEYSEFRDVGLCEENHKIDCTKKILNISFGLLLFLLILVILDIILVTQFDRGPYFAVLTKKYEDGGTREYCGLGYKVIKYHQVQGRRDTTIGFWSLKYNTQAITTQDLDLAIEFVDNQDTAKTKYMKKFMRIISTLQEVDLEKHEITLNYLDEDGKYSLDIICNVVEDQENIDSLEIGKETTIIGTMDSFLSKTEKNNNRVYISNCFVEQ